MLWIQIVKRSGTVTKMDLATFAMTISEKKVTVIGICVDFGLVISISYLFLSYRMVKNIQVQYNS